jgi:hypothetical protein
MSEIYRAERFANYVASGNALADPASIMRLYEAARKADS